MYHALSSSSGAEQLNPPSMLEAPRLSPPRFTRVLLLLIVDRAYWHHELAWLPHRESKRSRGESHGRESRVEAVQGRISLIPAARSTRFSPRSNFLSLRIFIFRVTLRMPCVNKNAADRSKCGGSLGAWGHRHGESVHKCAFRVSIHLAVHLLSLGS